jgi:hypothetical protein
MLLFVLVWRLPTALCCGPCHLPWGCKCYTQRQAGLAFDGGDWCHQFSLSLGSLSASHCRVLAVRLLIEGKPDNASMVVVGAK